MMPNPVPGALRCHHFRPCTVPLAGILALMLAQGCAVGPSYQRPAVPTGTSYAPEKPPVATRSSGGPGAAAQPVLVGGDIRADWWKLFGNKKLDQLIARAFAASPTIEAAKATLRGAQFDVYAQLGFFAPTVSAGYTFQRQQVAGNLSSNDPGLQGNGRLIQGKTSPTPPYNQPVTYNLHTAELTVGYTPDIFGSNIRQVEGLRATQRYQRWQLEAAYITLASNLVDAALQEASLRGQLQAARASLAANREALEILRHQQQTGYVMAIDVATQEQALATAEQALPVLEKQLAQTRDLIRELVGNPPDQDVPETFTLADFTLPADVPLSIPAQLLEQRPDIRAAEEQLHLASANVGVAVAARLPVFNITAAAGGTATVFDQMFSHGGPFWSLALAGTEPLFDGFTLYNKERSARASLRAAAAQYKSTVLQATQNVADTLHAVITDQQYLAASTRVEEAAAKILDTTALQARDGYVNQQTLLTAQEAYQAAVGQHVQAVAARFSDATAMYVALGGGWWHRAETANAGTDDPS